MQRNVRLPLAALAFAIALGACGEFVWADGDFVASARGTLPRHKEGFFQLSETEFAWIGGGDDFTMSEANTFMRVAVPLPGDDNILALQPALRTDRYIEVLLSCHRVSPLLLRSLGYQSLFEGEYVRRIAVHGYLNPMHIRITKNLQARKVLHQSPFVIKRFVHSEDMCVTHRQDNRFAKRLDKIRHERIKPLNTGPWRQTRRAEFICQFTIA